MGKTIISHGKSPKRVCPCQRPPDDPDLHFQNSPGFRYGRRVFLQAILPGAQNAVLKIEVNVQVIEIHVELFAVHVVQALPKCQHPVVIEVPVAHREVLEHAESVRYLLLHANHAAKRNLRFNKRNPGTRSPDDAMATRGSDQERLEIGYGERYAALSMREKCMCKEVGLFGS